MAGPGFPRRAPRASRNHRGPARSRSARNANSQYSPRVSEMEIGRRAEDGAPLTLAPRALLRHVMALGSSGSGKTVFCKVVVEEAVRRGIPAICVDPQGDLASFGAGVLDAGELAARGVDPAVASELAARAEVVVLTPGSSRGVPLSADPVDAALAGLEGSERVSALSRTAAMVVGLLGFDLDSDDGAGLTAVLDRALSELVAVGRRLSLGALTEHLFEAEKDDFAGYARLCDARKIRVACQRLARLDVGARRALFHGGVPIDVDVLLGRDPRAKVAAGKTRVAVIYLNTLHSQEDKDFFVAALCDRLYAWMLANPSPEPQALFYIDEVAPFIPPVRKPACKDGLSLLFKQARKYGVGCLMATQNPGDVDYRAMAQFGTWALGRLTTRQDLKKIEPTVKSLAPDQCDAILSRLPALKPGEMVLLSPDQLGAPVEIRTRWLATKHETWTEERIEQHADGVRARFASLIASGEGTSASTRAGKSANASTSTNPSTSTKTNANANASPSPNTDPSPSTDPSPGTDDADESLAPRPGRIEARDRAVLDALRRHSSASAGELAEAMDAGEGMVRRALASLVEAGQVRAYSEGRARRFWALETLGRPDLSMPPRVAVLAANVGEEDAARIGASHARSSVLGVIGEDERFERAERAHRLLYKVAFEEKVERPVLARLFGSTHDQRVGNVYLHPHTLSVLVFTNEDGVTFEAAPRGPASDLRDLDGAGELELVAPGALALDDRDWTAKKPEAAAREAFRARFAGTAGAVTPLFIPLWHIFLRGAKGSLRRVTIDGLIGRPLEWPEAE